MEETLVGRADLNPRGEDNFVLGFWLGGDFTGHGYATAACAALIAYGQTSLGAKRVYAGVTKGNSKSEAVLGRLGFELVEDRDTYTLLLLTVPPTDVSPPASLSDDELPLDEII